MMTLKRDLMLAVALGAGCLGLATVASADGMEKPRRAAVVRTHHAHPRAVAVRTEERVVTRVRDEDDDDCDDDHDRDHHHHHHWREEREEHGWRHHHHDRVAMRGDWDEERGEHGMRGDRDEHRDRGERGDRDERGERHMRSGGGDADKSGATMRRERTSSRGEDKAAAGGTHHAGAQGYY